MATRIVLALAFTACALIHSAPASAFKVAKAKIGATLAGDPYHEFVTTDGLLLPSVKSASFIKRSGRNIGFEATALQEVVEANREVDTREWENARYHFDSEEFAAANALLVVAHGAILESVRKKDFRAARKKLGIALHTLQDFYSHSTWIEQGGGAHPLLGTPFFNVQKTSTLDVTCTPFGLRSGAGITSGYFDLTLTSLAQIKFSPSYETSFYSIFPPGKCVHGSSEANSHLGGKGINKDSPSREGFDSAYLAAATSSAQYVVRILDELSKGQAADDEICGFLGQESSLECKAQEAVSIEIEPALKCEVRSVSFPDGPTVKTNTCRVTLKVDLKCLPPGCPDIYTAELFANSSWNVCGKLDNPISMYWPFTFVRANISDPSHLVWLDHTQFGYYAVVTRRPTTFGWCTREFEQTLEFHKVRVEVRTRGTATTPPEIYSREAGPFHVQAPPP